MATASQRVGVIGHTAFKASAALYNATAGFHNSVYRGKDVTAYLDDGTLWQHINGTNGFSLFEDLFIGDYFVKSGRTYRIAAFDYWLGCGDKNWKDTSGNYTVSYNTHHIVIVPDGNLLNADGSTTHFLNSTDVTTGAYVGSGFYSGTNPDGTPNTAKADCRAIINAAFGSAHVLSYRAHFQNAVTSGYESGGGWVDADVELMNERMVYGCDIFHNQMSGMNIPNLYSTDKTQLPLFTHEPSRITNRAYWWLRDVVSSTYFAFVDTNGLCSFHYASLTWVGVRPAFGIKA